MNFPTIGSVTNAVKNMQLTQKWQQRKTEINQSGIVKDNSKFAKTEEEQNVLSMLDRYKKQIAEQREQAAMGGITAKLKSGQSLSPAELDYLKENAPELYEEYVKIQKEREAYEKELKKCETKEDVRRVNTMKMNSFMNEAKAVMSANMPSEAKLQAMEEIQQRMMYIINDHNEFISSSEFQSMPETRAEAEEEREQDEKRAAEPSDEEQEDWEKLKDALKELSERLLGEEKSVKEGDSAEAGANAAAQDAGSVENAGGVGFEAVSEPDTTVAAADFTPATDSTGFGGGNAHVGGYNSASVSTEAVHISYEA